MGALAFSCLATAFAFCNVGAKSEQRRAMKTTAAKGAAVMAVTAQAQALKLVAQLLSAAIVAATLGGALQICCSLAGRLFLCFAAPIPLTPGRVAALAVTLAGLARFFGCGGGTHLWSVFRSSGGPGHHTRVVPSLA